jgi:outer membrane protein OmpA-like peptidoglycan-associated protein
MILLLICSGMLIVNFGTFELVKAQSVDEFAEALTPKSSTQKKRGVGGVTPPQAALYLRFGLDSATLTPQAQATLQNLGRALAKETLRQYVYGLEGHTCDRGGNALNMDLSKRRAQAVKQYLVRTFNLSANQFRVAWFGATQPLGANTDEAARSKNRRVIIKNTLRNLGKAAPGKSAVLQIKRLRNGMEEPVKDGEIIRQDDQYAVEFQAGDDRYVYIFQVDATGKLTPIFPNSQIPSKTNPVTPGAFYRIPESGEWFFLDENKGREQIFLLAQKVPLSDPIAMAKDVITGNLSGSQNRGLGGIRKKQPAAAIQKSTPVVSSRSQIFVLKRYFIHQ